MLLLFPVLVCFLELINLQHLLHVWVFSTRSNIALLGFEQSRGKLCFFPTCATLELKTYYIFFLNGILKGRRVKWRHVLHRQRDSWGFCVWVKCVSHVGYLWLQRGLRNPHEHNSQCVASSCCIFTCISYLYAGQSSTTQAKYLLRWRKSGGDHFMLWGKKKEAYIFLIPALVSPVS